MYAMKKRRVPRIEDRRRPAAVVVSDPSRRDWYSLSCSCGPPMALSTTPDWRWLSVHKDNPW